MKKLLFILYGFMAVQTFAQDSTTTTITPNGEKILMLLDSSHVDSLWRKGYNVDWLSGASLSKASPSLTHCSAFGAAFADRLGVYLLRPPQHSQNLLANAQCIWLATDTAAQLGWHKVNTALEAQNAADSGYLVVIGYQSPNPNTSGHFAIVRPDVKTYSLLKAEGPQETQSGDTNAISISEKLGFSAHPLAFPNGVIYYRHDVNWDSLNMALPVNINDFRVISLVNAMKISWQTATEQNTSHFIIQRSTDGSSFTDIGTVKAIGSGANSYSSTDNKPTNGINYYRLESVDKDGASTFSKVVSCELSVVSKQLTVYPNPAKSSVTVRGSHIASVQVIDNIGRVVKVVEFKDAANPSLSVSGLGAGVYHLRIQTTDGGVSGAGFLKE